MMENNKLIAEFMELPTEVSKAGLLNYYHREYNSGTWYEEHELSYNVSWDWLMPVVEKIYLIDADVDFFKNISLEDTYKAVVQFIENYE
jgi:hypothetical protein